MEKRNADPLLEVIDGHGHLVGGLGQQTDDERPHALDGSLHVNNPPDY